MDVHATLKRSWRKYKVFLERGVRTSPIPSDAVECHFCGHVYHGNYCPRCGQNRIIGTKRLTASRTFREAYPQLSNNYIRTVLQLLFRPGYMLRDYFRGHRVVYQSPLNALVITMSVIALCMGIYYQANQIEKKNYVDSVLERAKEKQNANPKETNYTLVFFEKIGLSDSDGKTSRREAILRTVLNNLTSDSIVIIVYMLPILGLSSYLASRKRKFDGRPLTLTEHYIVFAYLFVPITIFNPHPIIEIAYYVWTYRGLYGQTWWRAVRQTLSMGLWFALFMAILVLTLSLIVGIICVF